MQSLNSLVGYPVECAGRLAGQDMVRMEQLLFRIAFDQLNSPLSLLDWEDKKAQIGGKIVSFIITPDEPVGHAVMKVRNALRGLDDCSREEGGSGYVLSLDGYGVELTDEGELLIGMMLIPRNVTQEDEWTTLLEQSA